MTTKKAIELAEGHGNVKDLEELWNADAAVERITAIYNKNVSLIRKAFLNLADLKKNARKVSQSF